MGLVTSIIDGVEHELREYNYCDGCVLFITETGTCRGYGRTGTFSCSDTAHKLGQREWGRYHWFSPIVYELNKE